MSLLDFERVKWRVGRKIGRTIYAMQGDEPSDRDVLVGMMDRWAIAEEVVDAHNAKLDWKPPPDPLAAATAEVRTILLDEWSMDHLVVDDDGDKELALRVLIAAGVVDDGDSHAR